MQIAVILFSLVVFAVGIAVNQNSNTNSIPVSENEEAVINLSVTKNPAKEKEDFDILATEPGKGTYITPTITPSMNLSEYIYPGSEIVEKSDQELTLISSDEITNIVAWYKERIKARGFNINNFIITKTNGSELDKLTGSDNSKTVFVEITGTAGSAETKIKVTFE